MRRAQPWRTNRARALRSQSTSAEDLVWSHVRNRQLGGIKFIRQAAIGPYYVDLVCRENKVIVEIDGATHGTAAEIALDEVRSAYLQSQGYRVFRACNTEVFENIDGILDTLLAFVSEGKA